ncbi:MULTISPECIES: DUF6115 domain-containing protein [Bacillus]|uniref:Swarming motility protein SwrB n=1 Tax=Bacillus glycinifermentans TaxID=1664069 RepID=A0AAJ4D268_9BACI|nr:MULTISPECIES: hypothetical protein [Bacillus]KKB75580.1 Swarming motility protein SwrB [Bacillus sp. TH008]MBU8786447.1 Swarming motility protein SwrB [Bacillus glycinifermentans]MDU0071280.1 Swarming motility protein SwrB [Bacillus sp. IG6]MED8019205.1 Swarming motility protein SwrB [Bacillus glycinifermentans]NUJ17157.1 Swarming motility protein SwrB [Bacillus glycinifermentans]
MSTILWITSFMLHGILIYFVIILYTRLSAFKEAEKNQKQLLEETENTLTAFLMELKDENERLVSQLQQAGEHEVQQAEKHRPAAPEEAAADRPGAKDADDLPLHIESMIDEVERKEDVLNQEQTGEAVSFEEKAVALHEEGYSPEDIARQLKSGKTEIELLLKFRGKLKNDS